MSILISGSLAYDYIMDFPDSFKNHILPDQIHILNVSFGVSKVQKEFGGTAGNIAYTICLLQGDPMIVGVVGKDADPYINRLHEMNINTEHIHQSKETLTASAYITTDKDDNQITAFFGGPSVEPRTLAIPENKFDLALITPTHKNTIIEHAKVCSKKNIPLVFDPGQAITAFSAQELMLLIGQAKFLIGNDYEIKLLQDRTGWDMAELLLHVPMVITTLGAMGSIITNATGSIEIPACPPNSVDDPTGAGDAYRAGFFTAYTKGFDLKTCGQVGSIASTYAIEQYGTQNHVFTVDEFAERYYKTFNEKITF